MNNRKFVDYPLDLFGPLQSPEFELIIATTPLSIEYTVNFCRFITGSAMQIGIDNESMLRRRNGSARN